MNYEPLQDNFMIVSSPEEIGSAVITKIHFEVDDLIAQCAGITLPIQTLRTLQLPNEIMFIHDEWFAGFLLHSCDPNCKLDMNTFQLIAIKKIKVYDVLTIDYEDTEKQLYQAFNCLCGSPSCRKWIEGYGSKTI